MRIPDERKLTSRVTKQSKQKVLESQHKKDGRRRLVGKRKKSEGQQMPEIGKWRR